MRNWGRRGLFSGAVLAAGLVLAAPALAQHHYYVPVLMGNGTAMCGPCQPGPTVTHAAPNTAVIAHRYRWSPEERYFRLVDEHEVGFTDDQGDLRFTVPNGDGSLDKIVVSVGGLRSSAVLFLTNGGCGGPRLCPVPVRLHSFTNASAYLAGQGVAVTVKGATPGTVLEIAQQEYLVDGDRVQWVPTGEPLTAEVDALGQATVLVRAPGSGVHRAIAYDRSTGEESSFALYEVGEGLRLERFRPVW